MLFLLLSGKGGKGGPLAKPAMVGKTVRITRGKNKGLIGICIDATATHAKVREKRATASKNNMCVVCSVAFSC